MSRKQKEYNRKRIKQGKKERIDKLYDSKTGCVIIIKSCDPNLQARIFGGKYHGRTAYNNETR